MATLLQRISGANPESTANAAFVNAVYQQLHPGQNAPASVIKRFTEGGWKVKDVASTLMGDLNPFKGASGSQLVPERGGARAVKSGPGGQAGANTGATAAYRGNGGKYGELPKRDATGKFQWINPDGSVGTQPGFDPGTASWNYLSDPASGGAMHSAAEWQAAESFYKAHPNVQLSTLPPDQRQAFIEQAHREMVGSFQRAVDQGRTDLINELGNALSIYKRDQEKAGVQLSDDIRNTVNALEASGATFTGEGIRELGEAGAGSGVVTQDQLTRLQQNLTNIQQATVGAIDQGTAGADAFASGAAGTGMGTAGTGQYGINTDFNRTAGTGLSEGGVFQRNRMNYMESARSTLNQNVRQFGKTAEALLGTANFGGFRGPSIGGNSIFNPSQNVFGGLQGDYQTDTGKRVNKLEGDYYGQHAYTFQK